MQAKSGKKVKPVGPAKPDKPDFIDADGVSNDAKVNQTPDAIDKHKLGKQTVKPIKPKAADDEETEVSWIELEMVDEADEPMAGVKFEVKLPDDSVATGVLDSNGFARIDGCEPGECEITFPDLDKDAWEKIESEEAPFQLMPESFSLPAVQS